MKRHIRYAASGIRSTLFLTVLGCLLATGFACLVFQPASAARFSAPRAAAPQNYPTQFQELTAAPPRPAVRAQDQLQITPLEGGTALELRDGQMSCRAATKEEARAMRRDPAQQLRVIGDEAFAPNPPDQARPGLKIILRGTPQLEQFPEARAAFLRAARAWESLIQNPITVVIDVDFGPTAFGEPFREGQYGNTRFQGGLNANGYSILRPALIRSAGSPQEAALYNSLPAAQLPTDLGAASGMIFHYAALRALGLLPYVADPDAEQETLGPPPAIGFNAAFNFDFDPSDGIKPKRIDFNATAMHEIGHALGFFSGVGNKEMNPDWPLTPDMLDLFRFRPGVTSATFATAPRILSSGGAHIFFGGGAELPLSTARQDYTGGDSIQAGHWKDDRLTGRYIGIMNPVFSSGLRYEITANDLEAFERIGYRTNPLPNPQETELKLDDGTIDLGALGDGMMVINRLSPQSYPATLRKLRILIPAFNNQPDPAGKPITLVYASSAANGQPPPGAQFTRIEMTVPSASPDLFLEFTIPDGPTINSGDFYVGYQVQAPHQGVGLAVDSSGSLENRSFYSINNGASFAPLADVFQGNAATAMVRAIVSTGVPEPTPMPTPVPTPTPRPILAGLLSGKPRDGYIPSSSPTGSAFETQYFIYVPNGSTELKIELSANTDVDLYARADEPIVIQNGNPVAEFKSVSDGSQESITITPGSAPALKEGNYIMMIVNYGPGPSTFKITATVKAPESCVWTISPASQSFEAAGGSGTVKLTATLGCKWAIKSNVNWIAAEPEPLTSDIRSGFVSYAVAVNNSTSSRTGTVTIADQTFTVTQAGKSDGGGATEILSLDDGIARGVLADNGWIFVNRLTPSLYPATLRTVRIYFYQTNGKPGPSGSQIKLIVFAGPSGTQRPPDNPSLLLSQTLTIPALAVGGQFVDFPIENGPTINAGDFYVGYQLPTPFGNVAAWLDLSSMNNLRSFLSADNGATYYGPIPQQPGGYGSNLMVRAIISAGPSARSVVSVSAASFNGEALAREEIVAAFGVGMATGVQVATDNDPFTPGVQLPTTLLGTTVKVTDSAGTERAAPLFFVSPSQINYLIPPDTAVGTAAVTVTSGDGTVSIGTAQIASVAPGLFTASGDGQGAPAAVAMRYNANGALQSVEGAARLDQEQKRFVPSPLNLGEATDRVFLILYGTGLRHRQSLSTVSARIGGVDAPVAYAGKQSDFAGLDQINVFLPRSLIGRGEVEVELMVDGKSANKVRINIK